MTETGKFVQIQVDSSPIYFPPHSFYLVAMFPSLSTFTVHVVFLSLLVSLSLEMANGEQIAVTASTLLPAKFSAAENEKPPAWRYLAHLPASYDSSEKKKWPMIFYLHGRSIRGNDLNMVKRYGPPAFLDKKPDFPFVVISPQLPDHSWPTDSLLKLLDEVTKKYRVDPDRIYLTGVSMGGGGSWYLAAADQDRFAAFAPICGYGGTSLGKKLNRLPIWAFHGELDDIVPIEPHVKLVEAVNAAGGKAHLTSIPDGDHGNIIFPIYKQQILYDWFLAHRRGSPPQKSLAAKISSFTILIPAK